MDSEEEIDIADFLSGVDSDSDCEEIIQVNKPRNNIVNTFIDEVANKWKNIV